MPVEALPDVVEHIREKSLLIRRGTEIPDSRKPTPVKDIDIPPSV